MTDINITDVELKDRLKSYFDKAKVAVEKGNPERQMLREMYKNKESIDYFNMASEEERDGLFRSGMCKSNIDLRSSMLLDKRPRFFLNPTFKEEAINNFMEAVKIAGEDQETSGKYAWMAPELQKRNGNVNAFINFIVDSSVDDWWEKNDFSTLLDVLVKNASIDSKAWIKLRFNDKDEIVAEVIKECQVFADPEATLPQEREYIFFCKTVSTDYIKREYDFDASPDSDVSEKYQSVISTESVYKTKNVKLVEAYIRCGNKIVTYITGQDAYNGIEILDVQDNPYSDFPIIDFIPDKLSMTEGLPYSRDLAPFQIMDDKTVQQGFWNYQMVGNSKIIYEPSALINPKDLSNQIAQKIAVRDGGGVQFFPGINTTNESMGLHSIIQQMGRDKTGMHEISEGKTRGRIESSKAVVVVDDIIQRRLKPILRSLEGTLKRIFLIWGEMFLQVHKKDTPLRVGRNLRTERRLPFALASMIETLVVSIDRDTKLPKDSQNMANMMLTLAGTPAEDGRPYVPRSVVLDYLELENKDEILAEFNVQSELKNQLEQAGNMIAQCQEQLAQFQKAAQVLNEENEQLKMEKMAGSMKLQGQMILEQQKRSGINSTEEMRIEGDRQIEMIKAEMKKNTQAMLAVLDKELESTQPKDFVPAPAEQQNIQFSDEELAQLDEGGIEQNFTDEELAGLDQL